MGIALLPLTRYTVRLPASAFTGRSDHQISCDYEFGFTTKLLKPVLLYVQMANEPHRRKRLTFTAGAELYIHLKTAVATRLGIGESSITQLQCTMGDAECDLQAVINE